jgi:hypothetical protein
MISRKKVKSSIVNMRVDKRQKKFWEDMAKELNVKDLSSYMRNSVDRCLGADLRSHDPKWKKFVNAVKMEAKRILGSEIVSIPYVERVKFLKKKRCSIRPH